MNFLKNFRKKDFRINSVELCKIVNMFREAEGVEPNKTHRRMMQDIRETIDELKNVGIEIDKHDLVLISYKDSMNRTKPCYEMSGDFALQMLNGESAYVRYWTVQELTKREQQLKESELTKERRVSAITHNDLHEIIDDDRKSIGLDIEIYKIASYNLGLDKIYAKESLYRRNKEHLEVYDRILSKAYELLEMFKRRSKDGHFVADVIEELKYEFVDDIDRYKHYVRTHEKVDFLINRKFGR